MAKPRIFISSTYYDLKYIRASLDLFVDSLGFEPVLSEKGDIAYTPERPLDESCYREVENADIFVLIVGGRYGSEVSAESKRPTKTFFDRYESITKREYESAAEKDVPIYILIEKGVHAEYQTYVRNKGLTEIKYAHVDSVNVFILIEEILARPRNNPVHTFERFEEIETWLRDQWAGLFRELLRRQTQQRQLAGLTAQVHELKATNDTLKTYLEAVMRGVDKQETNRLIESEERRLEEIRRQEALKASPWVLYLADRYKISADDAIECIKRATSFTAFAGYIAALADAIDAERRVFATLARSSDARKDFNKARALLERPAIELSEDERSRHDSEPVLLRRPIEHRAAKSIDVAVESEATEEPKAIRKRPTAPRKGETKQGRPADASQETPSK